MAKNVSTKFGDRRLVYLPPINIEPNRTPDVRTLAKPRQSNGGDEGAIVPKDYAYGNVEPKLNDDVTRNYFLNGPKRPEGNLVLDKPSPERNVVSERIFEQLLQQAKTDTLQGYNQGRYPVMPSPDSPPHQMQYTNYGLRHMQPQAPPPGGQIQPASVQQGMQPAGQMVPQYNAYNPPTMPTQQQFQPVPAYIGGNDPNEKHIYYGPNGEILPGPPNQMQPQRGPIQDFAIEGLLRHGRLTAVNLFESASGFPTMPEFLINDLLAKYGQYELTLVRIVARGGQCYVHATPQIPMVQPPPLNRPPPPPNVQMQGGPSKTEYVPVYLDEDEEFDYDKFMAEYKSGKYKSVDPKTFRSLPPPDQRKFSDQRATPIEIKSEVPSLPYRDPVTPGTAIIDFRRPARPGTEDYRWQYDRNRPSITRAWDTRQDIRPVERLKPSNRY